MNVNKLNKNNLIVLTSKTNGNNLAAESEEVHSIPNESSCSPEFSEGCIFRE